MKFKKKIRKGLCKVTSAFLSVLILFSMTAYGSAPPENKNVLLNEASVSYENYTLEDLPKAVKESVMSSEKTPMEIVESAPEDLYSVTVKNEDGSNTLSIFGQPIKYIDEDGTIRVKRNELNKSDKLSSLFEKYAFECTDNVIKGYFPKKTDKEIKMVYNDFDITFAPIINKENNSIFDAVLDFLKSGKEKTEASGLIPSDSVINGETETGDNITSLDTTVKEEKETEETKTPYPDIPETSEETVEPAQTSLPETSQKEEFVSKEAVLSGGKEGMVVYENVFSEHISLEYMPVLGGIKENIVLEQYEGINEFEFIINTRGLIPAENSGISIDLLNPNTNEIELCIGQVDSKDSFTGENVNNDVHFTLENSMELRPTGENSEYILKIIVDKSFLESEATVYPVTIDPTVTIGVDPIYDAPVFSGYPNTNYRTNAYNTVGYYNSSYKEAITYFKVDCMTSYNYIDPAKVTSAYLHTYETSGHTSSVTIQVHDTMSTWVNSSITYANRPDTYNYNASNNVNLTNTNTWYNFTITGLVIDWLNYERDEGGWTQNFGFALVPSTSGASYRQFCSANHSSNLPSIVINYSDLRTIPDGMYFIRSKHSDLYLDTDPAQSANGNVIQYTFHGGKDQRWFVKYQSNGYYKFYTPQHNNTKCLDVVSNPTTNGARIDVYPDGSGDWLLFQIISNGDGSYRIKSKWSGNKKTLDVTGPSTAPGTNIQLWQYGNVNQQKWIFEASGSYINMPSRLPNCMGYALLCIDLSDYYPIFNTNLTSELTEDYIDDIISSIKTTSHLVARSIDAYNSTIYLNEYRIAARVYFGDDNIRHYHFIYQLSNGSWAGKDGFNNSKYLGYGNPSNLDSMWENGKYPASAGTEYFAVHFDLNEVLS